MPLVNLKIAYVSDNESSPIIHTINLSLTDDPPISPTKFILSTNPFGKSVTIHIAIKRSHPTIRLNLSHHLDNQHLILYDITPSTPAHHIFFCQSTLCKSIVISIGNTIVNTIEEMITVISNT